jgi:hypothetical protein
MSNADQLSTEVDKGQNNTEATKQNIEIDVGAEQLAGRMEEIKREIVLLEEQKVAARAAGDQERSKIFDLWKQKIIASDAEFTELAQKIGEKEVFYDEQIRKKHTEYRLTRINFLTQAKPPDSLRQRVLDLNVKENLDKLQGKDIQAGGSNAKGVFEIENGDFVLIKKSKGTYEYEGALPYLMQDVGTERIPRVLEVFETDNATYKVMEKAKGVQVDTLSADEIAQIPQEHFDQFVEDIARLDGMGLQIDPSKRSNFFYDKNIGFSIIDIGDPHYDPMRTDVRSNVHLGDLKAVLSHSGQDQKTTNKIEEAIRKQSKNQS